MITLTLKYRYEFSEFWGFVGGLQGVVGVKKIRIGNRWIELERAVWRGAKFLGDLEDWYIHCDTGGFPRFWDDDPDKPLTRHELMDVEEKLCSQCKFRGRCLCLPDTSESFPPEECTDEVGVEPQERCPICGRWFDEGYKDVVVHHLNYARNRTILVCRSCHAKIHHSKDNLNLKPVDKRPKPERKFKYVSCPLCGGRARVPIDGPDEGVLCSRCRKKLESMRRTPIVPPLTVWFNPHSTSQ
jgi:hypothetical protein